MLRLLLREDHHFEQTTFEFDSIFFEINYHCPKQHFLDEKPILVSFLTMKIVTIKCESLNLFRLALNHLLIQLWSFSTNNSTEIFESDAS